MRIEWIYLLLYITIIILFQIIIFDLNFYFNVILVSSIITIYAKSKYIPYIIFLFIIYNLILINNYYFGLLVIIFYLWMFMAQHLIKYYGRLAIIIRALLILFLVSLWHLLAWIVFRGTNFQIIFPYVILETFVSFLALEIIKNHRRIKVVL